MGLGRLRGATPPSDPPALGAYAIDGVVPRRHVAATSDAHVVDAIRSANADGEAIVIWGGGTRIDVGDTPERYDVALDLRGVSGIVDHQPADLTVTVRGGTTVAELQEALAPHGQWWPVEVAHPGRATVAGTLVSAAGGPARYRYFHPRDWAIGVRAVLGDGTLTKAGGRVVKNVTGYDLTRMYSGSFGTLCAVVELTLKLVPLPRHRVTLRADLPSLGYAYRVVRELIHERPPLEAIALVTGAQAGALGCDTWTALFMRLGGTAPAAARVRASLGRVGAMVEVGHEVWQRISDLPADATTSLRGTWPPGQPVEPYGTDSVWYPGVESMHVLDEQTAEAVRQLRSAAEASAGALIVERAPRALRREVGTWGTPRVPTEVSRRLRSLFDPRAVLAPGRMP